LHNASSALSRVAGVVRVFSSDTTAEIILEVVASDKRSLDHTIMAVIQGEAGIVTSTRSYILINAMQWRRD
jgi:ferredoxin-fold anticodon binding domain-containing protein